MRIVRMLHHLRGNSIISFFRICILLAKEAQSLEAIVHLQPSAASLGWSPKYAARSTTQGAVPSWLH